MQLPLGHMQKKTMTRIVIILLTFLSGWTNTYACLNTYQFKIFPIGIYQDKIVTVDVQVRRTSQIEGNRWLGLNLKNPDEFSVMWILCTRISTYDKNQKTQSSTPIDTVYAIGKDYSDTLLSAYQACYNSVLKQYPSIELFTPDYISFCDYQKKCDLLSVTNDTIQNTDYLTLEEKKYPIKVIRDTSYFAFNNSPYHSGNTTGLYISSTRTYKTESMTLVLAHLETGHEISMGWITNDPNKKSEEEGDPVIVSKEHKPGFEFNNLDKAVYQEPLLHHGYGFDIFIIKE